MSKCEETRMEIMWSVSILKKGFSSIPNELVYTFRKLGIEHGEWSLICHLLTFKHDNRNPYPSRKTLAERLDCSERQITKWITSLTRKGLLLTEKRQSGFPVKWTRTEFNFQPLIDAVEKWTREETEKSSENTTIQWAHNQSVSHESAGSTTEQKQEKTKKRKPEVPIVLEPEVPIVLEPEVPTKKKREKEKKKDDDDRAYALEILQFEFVSSQLLDEREFQTIMKRVTGAQPTDMLAYGRKSLLRGLQRKKELAYIHKSKIENEASRDRLRGHKQKRAHFTLQRQAIPIVQPREVTPLSPEEYQRARELARRLDSERECARVY